MVIGKILQRVLGKYIDGIDKENLSVSIWQGKVDIENLMLKKNLFEILGLPFTIKYSKVKKLKLIVPITSISSQPMELTLESLILVVAPLPRSQWQVEDQWSFNYKMRNVEEFIQTMVEKLKQQVSESHSSNTKESGGYFDKMIIKIIDNVQVTIKNIHLRYEDDIQIKDLPFSFGFTLKELSIKTTNATWETSFFDRLIKENRDKPLFKMLNITGLALYVDTLDQEKHIKKNDEYENDEDFQARVEQYLFDLYPLEAIKVEDAQYFIEPINLTAHLVQLTKIERERPMYSLDIKLDELNITLTKEQYEVILKIADIIKDHSEFLERSQVVKKYKYLRPVYPLSNEETKHVELKKRKITSRHNKKDSMLPISESQVGFDTKNELTSASQLMTEDINDSEMFFDAMDTSIMQDEPPHQADFLKSLILDQQAFLTSDDRNLNAIEWWKYAIKCVRKDNRAKKGYWSEFKISIPKKRQYGILLIKMYYKLLNDQLEIDYSLLSHEDQMIMRHIFEANDINDLKNWIGISFKKKMQKVQEIDTYNKKKAKSTSGGKGFFSMFGGNSQNKNMIEDPLVAPSEELSISDGEIKEIEGMIQSVNKFLEENNEEDTGTEITISPDEKKQIVKYSLAISFEKGKINLIQQGAYSIRFFQELLKLDIQYRNNDTFESIITNQSIGVYIEIFKQEQHDIISPTQFHGVKQIISQLKDNSQTDFETEQVLQSMSSAIMSQHGIFRYLGKSTVSNDKKAKEGLWTLKIAKVIEPGNQVSIIDLPLKISYDAVAVGKFIQFFKTEDCSEEIRAQAYDKFQALKEQTQISIKDMFQQQRHRISVKVHSPILEIPFQYSLIGQGEVIEGGEQMYDRMWIVNVGDIGFRTGGKTMNGSQIEIDMYERYALDIEKLSLKYTEIGDDQNKQQFQINNVSVARSVNVLNEIELHLDIGLKNNLKAAVLVGNESSAFSEDSPNPDVKVIAHLPQLSLNVTPDVYNGLVNLHKILSQKTNVAEDLKKLKTQKKRLIISSIFRAQVKTQGVLRSHFYWEPYYMMISGSYIYFYTTNRDLVPQLYLSINDTQVTIIPNDNSIQKDDIVLNQIKLHPRGGTEICLSFEIIEDYQKLIKVISAKHNHQTFRESVSDRSPLRKSQTLLAHQNPNDLKFNLSFKVDSIELALHKNDEISHSYDSSTAQPPQQEWLTLRLLNMQLNVLSYAYETKVQVRLSSLSIRENNLLNEEIIKSEIGQKVFEVDVDVYNIYSPNLKDAEMMVTVQLSQIYMLFHPEILNDAIKYFRKIKYQDDYDLEGQYQLISEEEIKEALKQVEDESLFNEEDLNKSQLAVKMEPRKQNCKDIRIILIKLNLQASGLRILALHNKYYDIPIFEMSVGRTIFSYKMYYDHDIISGEFGNVLLYDLTNYPQTNDPDNYNPKYKATLQNIDKLTKREIIGLKDNNQGSLNAILFELQIYREGCCLIKPEAESILTLDIAQIKILFVQELSFRIIDYFFDKFLWAITDTDPYPPLLPKQKKKIHDLNESDGLLEQIHEINLDNIELKQARRNMQMNINISRPCIIVKDRPYSETYLEIDLGEISVTSREQDEIGKFYSKPEMKALTQTFVINLKDMGIRYQPEGFKLTKPFGIEVEFTALAYSPQLININSKDMNKSHNISISLIPRLHLNLRQDIYTFILRCIDLNFAYTDSLNDKYNFRILSDYFATTIITHEILKSTICLKTSSLSLALSESANAPQLTELALMGISIKIEQYLNGQMNHDIEIDELCSYFIKGNEKHLLFGSLTQKHQIGFELDILNTFTKEVKRQSSTHQEDYYDPHFQITAKMYPDGRKNFQITLRKLKLFIQPYFYLMLDIFFREGQPVYDEESFDKPNEYTSDIENCTEIFSKIIMKEVLVCLRTNFNNNDDTIIESKGIQKTIACMSSIEYEFKRDKIKKVKQSLQKSIQFHGEKLDKNLQQPYFLMGLHLNDFSPFICDLQDLENAQLNEVRKRQVIAPFDFKYYYSKFLQYRKSTPDRILNYEKSEL